MGGMTSQSARRLELGLSGEESKLGKLRTRKTAHLKGSDARSLISDLPKYFRLQRLKTVKAILGKTLQEGKRTGH